MGTHSEIPIQEEWPNSDWEREVAPVSSTHSEVAEWDNEGLEADSETEQQYSNTFVMENENEAADSVGARQNINNEQFAASEEFPGIGGRTPLWQEYQFTADCLRNDIQEQ